MRNYNDTWSCVHSAHFLLDFSFFIYKHGNVSSSRFPLLLSLFLCLHDISQGTSSNHVDYLVVSQRDINYCKTDVSTTCFFNAHTYTHTINTQQTHIHTYSKHRRTRTEYTTDHNTHTHLRARQLRVSAISNYRFVRIDREFRVDGEGSKTARGKRPTLLAIFGKVHVIGSILFFLSFFFLFSFFTFVRRLWETKKKREIETRMHTRENTKERQQKQEKKEETRKKIPL